MTAIATLPVLLGTGIHSARPAATDVGAGGLYACSTHSLVYQTDGATWSTWATLGGSSDLDAIIAASSGQDIADALAGAAAPDAGNVFATMADLSSGGALTFIQQARSDSATVTMPQTPQASSTLLLALDMFNSGTATAVASTNTTWTKIGTFTDSGGAIIDLWHGNPAGSAGTSITITHPNSFIHAACIEVDGSLGTTLASSATASNDRMPKLAVSTAGRVCVMIGITNSSGVVDMHPAVRGAVGHFSDTDVTIGAVIAAGGSQMVAFSFKGDQGNNGSYIAELS